MLWLDSFPTVCVRACTRSIKQSVCLWSVANSLASFDMKMTFIEMKYEMISKYEIGNWNQYLYEWLCSSI